MKLNLNLLKFTLFLLAISLTIVILILARDFLYPICLAILFSYLLYPLTRLLERWKLPRVLAILISLMLVVAVIAISVFLLYQQLTFFIEDFPSLKEQALKNIDQLQLQIDDITDSSSEPQGWWLRQQVANLLNSGGDMINKIFNATTGTMVKMGLQPVFIFFMLYYRERFTKFIYLVTKERHHTKVTKILNQISELTKKYVSGVFIVVIMLCFINTAGLMIIGVDYAIMFGILSAVMNFIPYFGTLIGAAIPLSYTLVSDTPEQAFGVVILFIIIQFTENNILTPTITGGRVAINPLFTILIIIAGGMIWGIPGMFMSVPFVGMFKVVCSHYKTLEPIAYVMSRNKGDELSDKMRKIKNWFSRKR